jgi:hypothetical protein
MRAKRRTHGYIIALLFLCLYGAGLAHLAVPGHSGHHDPDTCGLCVLLFGVYLPGALTVLLALAARPAATLSDVPVVFGTPLWQPRLRGPPA